MNTELLRPAQMSKADRLAIAGGPFSGYQLMCRAGHAVAAAIMERFTDVVDVLVLCGPGNNGGDGYEVARLLRNAGFQVAAYADKPPVVGTDAALALAAFDAEVQPIQDFEPQRTSLVVDALFGAGLSKDLSGAAADAIDKSQRAECNIVAIDLPSGISGDSGAICGTAFKANLTVTFFRKKPGHLLYPGRSHCGELLVADIGIPETVLEKIEPLSRENTPDLWLASLCEPATETHKYQRGHVGVFSGGPTSTGAVRLAAVACQRIGAGAVTVLSPPAALQVNATHLTSVMLKRIENVEDIRELKAGASYLIGPGFGVGDRLHEFVACLLEQERKPGQGGIVVDADAITAFESDPVTLFEKIQHSTADVVLTPHSGEFSRLFPDLAGNRKLSKLDKATAAARHSGAVVILKGADTIIAAPDGRGAINSNGTSWLATAGSGDTLAGLCAGLLAQEVPVFEAACCAVWIHAECAQRFGPGLIAEDLADMVPGVLADLLEMADNTPAA